MEIKFNLTLDDIINFKRFHFVNSTQFKKTVLISKISFFIFLFAFMLITFLINGEWIVNIAVTIVVSIVFVLMIKKDIIRRFNKLTQKHYENNENSSMVGIYEMKIKDDVLVVKTPISEEKILWHGLTKISEQSEYAFIYQGSDSAFVIPKDKIISGNIENFLIEIKLRTSSTRN